MKLLLICIVCIMLGACSKEQVYTFTIVSITPESILVNCSEQATAGMKGNINSIGYICEVFVEAQTDLLDEAGRPIALEQISEADSIIVRPVKNIKISEKNLQLTAKTVQVVN